MYERKGTMKNLPTLCLIKVHPHKQKKNLKISNNLKESRTKSMHSRTGMKARKIPAKKFTPNTEEIFRYKLL